jgi:hypothetical protein
VRPRKKDSTSWTASSGFPSTTSVPVALLPISSLNPAQKKSPKTKRHPYTLWKKGNDRASAVPRHSLAEAAGTLQPAAITTPENSHLRQFAQAYEFLTERSGFFRRGFPTIGFALRGNPRGADHGGTSMQGGLKGSVEPVHLQCAVCGCRGELFDLSGRKEKYCLECSADVATSILLTTEIDAATCSGEETAGLVSEFVQLSRRLLARAQLQ